MLRKMAAGRLVLVSDKHFDILGFFDVGDGECWVDAADEAFEDFSGADFY